MIAFLIVMFMCLIVIWLVQLTQSGVNSYFG
jgi:hypothetical protein